MQKPTKQLDYWIYSTIKIENQNGNMGTGFVISHQNDKEPFKVFLITNKHVIHPKKEHRHDVRQITLHLNIKESETSMRSSRCIITLPKDKSAIWREHPDDDVDVMAISIFDQIQEKTTVMNLIMPSDYLVTDEIMQENEISTGDEVLIIGYPDIFPFVVSQGGLSFPIVRNGMIASRLGSAIEEQKNRKGDIRKLRGFLVDGGILPGSSGSPIVLKPVSGRVVGQAIMAEPPPPFLLGIAAEERKSKRQGDRWLPANMGFAYDAATIREVIEMFYQ